MKNVPIVLAIVGVALLSACSSSPQPGSQERTPDNANTSAKDHPQSVIGHSGEPTQQPMNAAVPAANSERTNWTQSGNPIDTHVFDTEIKAAEKALNRKPADRSAKKKLGDAYMRRAMALTEAKQYASALGDYRKAVVYDPTNDEAKGWIDKIVMIYDSMNRQYPKEGEEPPALPFKKGD